jgi:ABC-type Fe3+/spermidine/putrescine transport system ATPase subunit
VIRAGGALLKSGQNALRESERVDACIRPEQVILTRREPDGSEQDTFLHGRIVEETAHGSAHSLLFEIDRSDLRLEVDIAAHPYEVLGVAGRREWWLQLRRDSLHVMPVDQLISDELNSGQLLQGGALE